MDSASPPRGVDAVAAPLPALSPRAVPLPADGLQLYGEYEGSGFAEPQYVARRADGQVLQLTRLLHLVTSEIDGRRDLATIADRVTESFGRPVSPDNVAYLLERKLAPLGLVRRRDGAEEKLPRSNPLLGLNFRGTLLKARWVEVLAGGLAWLHLPLVVAAVLGSVLAVDVWLFAVHGGIEPLLAILREPLLLLVIAALQWVNMLVHELGHASACRYSGARPGRIGYGLYIIWPAFYTDVTDVYRIGRAGRLRTDFGGIYFDVVFMLAMAAGYWVTGHPVFLAAFFFGHFDILDQLLPIVRFDGYYILGDLVGVPDLYGKVGPILKSALPGRPVDPRVAMLRPRVRRIVTAWVMVVVPLILALVSYGLYHLPRIVRTAWESFWTQVAEARAAAVSGDWPSVVLEGGSAFALCLPAVGTIYISYLFGRSLLAAGRNWAGTDRRKWARLVLVALALVAVVVLSWLLQ